MKVDDNDITGKEENLLIKILTKKKDYVLQEFKKNQGRIDILINKRDKLKCEINAIQLLIDKYDLPF